MRYLLMTIKGKEGAMDTETKKSLVHEIVLTFDIIIAACIVAGAIVFAAVFAGKHQAAYGTKIHEGSVKRQFADQMQAVFQLKPVVQGEARTLKRVDITDLRHSIKSDQLLVEFTLMMDPAASINSSCILVDDGFGRYSGQWGRDSAVVQLIIR
jgi:hypothetical protein